MKMVKAFQCEFCLRKVMMNKAHLAKHEAICFHNPKRKACQTCGNYDTEWESDYIGHQFGEAAYGEPYKLTWCTAKDKDPHDMPKCETCDFI